MDAKRLLKEVKLSSDKIKEEIIDGDINGCIIWIREGRRTEIQSY